MDDKLAPSPSIRFGPGGFVERVVYAPCSATMMTRPDSPTSNPGLVRPASLAPSAFTPDVPLSGDVDCAAGSPPVPTPTKSGDVGEGKVLFSHVERNERTNMSPPRMSPTAAIGSAVERVIHAAESREASARVSGLASEASPGGGMAFEEAALHGGPLASSELAQLSLQCAACVGAAGEGGAMPFGAWASLDATVSRGDNRLEDHCVLLLSPSRRQLRPFWRQ